MGGSIVRAVMQRGPDGAAGSGVEQREAVRTEREPDAVADRTVMIGGQSGLRPGHAAVSTVTICVVPRYSVPKTSPRSRGLIVEAHMLGPHAEDQIARRQALARRRNGDARRRRADRGRARLERVVGRAASSSAESR